jgi:7-cyano-7-deazaguanine synthase in queuosine biosynthesis
MDLFQGQTPKSTCVLVSGGCDSALALAMVCKYNPKVEIYTYTGIQPQNKVDFVCARNILKLMKSMFPSTNLKYHTEASVNPSPDKLPKHNQHIKNLENIPSETYVIGTTLNPPFDIEGRELARDEIRDEIVTNEKGNITYLPWINKNKKEIADIYRKEGLIETLFPLTNSCIDVSDDGTICNKCFWCKERAWGFE